MKRLLYLLRIITTIILISFFNFSSKSQSIDVLFVGNSYTYYNNLPQLISNIALSFGDTVNTESSTPGGASFFGHVNNATTLAKINQQPWDYVVLQDQSQKPSLSPSYVATNVYPYATQLVDAIQLNNICAEPVFYMTWGRKNGDASNCAAYPPVCTYLGMQQRLRESYLEMGITNSATVSPVGMAWKNYMELDSITDLYNADGSHPSIYGSYLAACTFYATIFKKSPIGSTFIPSQIDPSTGNLIQQVAANTVLDSLSTWNIFNADFEIDTSSNSIAFTNHSSNYDSLTWFFGDGMQSNDVHPSHNYSSSGVYQIQLVIYTNQGCFSDTASYTYSVSSSNDVINQTINDVYAYPNPTNNLIKIKIVNFNGSFKAELYDFTGKLLETTNKNFLSLGDYPSGTYLLKVAYGDKVEKLKVIKD